MPVVFKWPPKETSRASPERKMQFLRPAIVFLFICSTLPALGGDEYVVVEWANLEAARKFEQSCGISLELLPVSEGARKRAHRLTPNQLDSCEGLTRKLPSSSLFRATVMKFFAGLEGLKEPLPLLREGAFRTVELVTASELRRQAEQVQFFEFPWGQLKPDLNRRGYVFLAHSKKIIVNSSDASNETVEAENSRKGKLSSLLLHEVLQAMGGYYDRYYEFSTALWLFSQIGQEASLAKPHLEQLRRMAEALAGKKGPVRVAGGCSLICGGGDGNEAYFKQILLTLVLQRKEFRENPAIQRKVIWKTIASEIHEVQPAECELLQRRGIERCNLYGAPGSIYFVGAWLKSMDSVPRMVESAVAVLKDIVNAVQAEELE